MQNAFNFLWLFTSMILFLWKNSTKKMLSTTNQELSMHKSIKADIYWGGHTKILPNIDVLYPLNFNIRTFFRRNKVQRSCKRWIFIVLLVIENDAFVYLNFSHRALLLVDLLIKFSKLCRSAGTSLHYV